MVYKIIEISDIKKRFDTYDIAGSGFFDALINRKHYVKPALKGVSFSVNQGEIVALLGKNGSGKSTLLKIITGILFPDEGSIRVLGFDPWEDRKKLAMHMGVVLGAHGQLYWDLPASDSFELMKKIYKVSDRDYKERLEHYIEMLDLKHVYKRQVRTLSLGEQMKCNFVASMLHEPELVLLDEPTIGVDLSSRAMLRETIREARDKNKTTFLLTTHITEDLDMADRVVMLNKGKKIFDDSQENMLKLFGNKRKINLKFRNNVDANIYAKFGKIVTKQPNYLELEVHEKTLKNLRFIKLLADANLMDYSVVEPGLGEVILKLYAREKARSEKG